MFVPLLLSLAYPASILALSIRPRNGALPSWEPTITWSERIASDHPRIQRGFITVPMDYHHVEKGRVELGMVRFSTVGKAPLGTLFYNPGGPGGVASEDILAAAQDEHYFGPPVLENYDILGLDPRGVGMTQPVKCNPDLFNERVSSFPTTEDDLRKLITHNEAFGKSCFDLTGPLLNHLDTVNLAKDMECVRRALNSDEKLNFFGYSYGSQVGLTYAELYPENVNRMALDGILDHTQDETTTLNDEATAYEMTLDRFFAWCNTTIDCTLHGQNAAGIFQSILRKADEQPIPAPGCSSTGESACRSDVTAEEIRTKIQNLLLFQNATDKYPGWDLLSRAMAETAEGNATLLSSPLATSESFEAYAGLAIGCQDWLHESTTLADLWYKINMASATTTRTRGSTQTYYYQSKYIRWPAPNTNPQRRLGTGIERAPPILLVNSKSDPSTSIVWATGIQRQVPGSVLLTRSGNGHTSYALGGEAAAAIDAFLVEGVLPRPATVVDS